MLFLNGDNVIRCSDTQVVLYKHLASSKSVFSDFVHCNNSEDIYSENYSGFIWRNLNFLCSMDNREIHAVQYVLIIQKGSDVAVLPNAQAAELYADETFYHELTNSINENDETVAIHLSSKPANSAYFGETNMKMERIIYLWFPNHPIICRIKFTSDSNIRCPEINQIEANNANYACYYRPGIATLPTAVEMEAEFDQLREYISNDDGEYVLLLTAELPGMTPINAFNSSQVTNNMRKISVPSSTKVSVTSKPAKQRTNLLLISGIIFIILLIIVLIGIAVYYVICRNRSRSTKNGSSDSLDTNRRSLSNIMPNEHKSYVSEMEPWKNERPNIQLQKNEEKTRPHISANMIFNDDM